MPRDQEFWKQWHLVVMALDRRSWPQATLNHVFLKALVHVRKIALPPKGLQYIWGIVSATLHYAPNQDFLKR